MGCSNYLNLHQCPDKIMFNAQFWIHARVQMSMWTLAMPASRHRKVPPHRGTYAPSRGSKLQQAMPQKKHLDVGQYLLIPFLVGWTSIYQLFWGSLGTRVLTHPHLDVDHQAISGPSGTPLISCRVMSGNKSRLTTWPDHGLSSLANPSPTKAGYSR